MGIVREVSKDLTHMLNPKNDTEYVRVNENDSVPRDFNEPFDFVKEDCKRFFFYFIGFAKPLVRSGIVGGGLGAALSLFTDKVSVKEGVSIVGAPLACLDMLQYSIRNAYYFYKGARRKHSS